MSELRQEGKCFSVYNTQLQPEAPLLVPGPEAANGIECGDHMDIELVIRYGGDFIQTQYKAVQLKESFCVIGLGAHQTPHRLNKELAMKARIRQVLQGQQDPELSLR